MRASCRVMMSNTSRRSGTFCDVLSRGYRRSSIFANVRMPIPPATPGRQESGTPGQRQATGSQLQHVRTLWALPATQERERGSASVSDQLYSRTGSVAERPRVHERQPLRVIVVQQEGALRGDVAALPALK